MERIGVIGGAGFIGRSFVERVRSSEHEVILLPRFPLEASNRGTEMASAISAYSKQIDSSGVSTVVNLAWAGLPDYTPSSTSRNVRIATLIHEASLNSAAECVVGIGSCLEYGDAIGPISETTAAVSPTFFGRTKTWLAEHLQASARELGKRSIWVRPFWLIGRGQRPTSLVPSVLRAAANGLRQLPKNPDAVADFVDLDDFSDALLRVMLTKKADGTFNVGSGHLHTAGQVASVALSIALGDSSESFCRNNLFAKGGWSTNERILETAGWTPQTTLRETIQKMWEDLPR